MFYERLSPLHPQPFASTRRQKVLVIDDVAVNTLLVAGVLSSVCEVLTAASGPEGLTLAHTQCPDLILLDVLMPEMDGFEVYHQLKQAPDTAHIPVIFLTAAADAEIEQKSLDLGAADFISKPFRGATLLARVRNHLKLEQQRQLLTRLAHSDYLTGIANRRYFNAMLSRAFARMQSPSDSLALLMMDVDDFKAFNDYYGHVHGDDCLQRIAQALAHTMRNDHDILARYGGEEFVCLLPGAGLPEALQLAQQIQDRIAALGIPHVHAQAAPFVTLSIGAAALRASEASTEQQLLALADERLYRAKRNGRNCVIGHDIH